MLSTGVASPGFWGITTGFQSSALKPSCQGGSGGQHPPKNSDDLMPADVATYNYDAVGNLLSITWATVPANNGLAILSFAPQTGFAGSAQKVGDGPKRFPDKLAWWLLFLLFPLPFSPWWLGLIFFAMFSCLGIYSQRPHAGLIFCPCNCP